MKISVSDKNIKTIQPDMFGLFFEDINYGLDGGLHAEMLENRNFEALICRGRYADFTQAPAYRYGWEVYPRNAGVYLDVEDEKPLNDVNPHYLRVYATKPGQGFMNKAFDGLFMKKDVPCSVSFYARGNAVVQIRILNPDGTLMAMSEEMTVAQDEWRKYETSVVCSEDVHRGIFYVCLLSNADVCFDQFSMIPGDAVMGLFRRDLAEMLKSMKPGFLRFPGGCVVEGGSLENRYQWKKTVGPKELRKANWNRWAVHENDQKQVDVSPWAFYNQTLGIGFYEYFLLCEYLGCRALPVLNAGIACQYQTKELVPSDSPEFEEFIQDALDLIEFANGSTDSTWGALRAEMGHPEPFNLTYISIGNEQWETETVDFFHRYERFQQAIHAKYPNICCLGSAGPNVGSDWHKNAWNHYLPRMKADPEYAYAVDEHYYVPEEWLYDHVHMYDGYDRAQKVFAGEYACHIQPAPIFDRRNTFGAALAEAAFMTGLERNCDVVLLASYAPLLSRLGYAQWSPDLIWFDGKDAYGTPSYYVQKLFSLYTGDEELTVTEDHESQGLYTCVSRDQKNGCVYVKLINAGEEKAVSLSGVPCESVQAVVLAGNKDSCNSIRMPNLICPVMQDADPEQLTLPENSVTILICK